MAGGVDDLEGQTLGGRYRLERAIGRGGMGAVLEAVQLDLGRKVAVKVLLAADPRSVDRFRREALAASALTSPHVVSVYDFQAPPDGVPFLVMELLEGCSLASLLRQEGALPVGRASRIASQMLVALEAAHRAGIIHRDIKPSNVWLVSGHGIEDHVKVLDFGIAKLLRPDVAPLTTMSSFLGTPAYLAPEQIRGLDVDARTDIHAVGTVLYEMIAGHRPWKGDLVTQTADILERVPPLLRELVPSVPLPLAVVVARAMAKDPEVRYARADEMRHALAPFVLAPAIAPPTLMESQELSATPPSRALTPERAGTTSSSPTRRTGVVFVVSAAVAFALAAVVAGALLWRSRAVTVTPVPSSLPAPPPAPVSAVAVSTVPSTPLAPPSAEPSATARAAPASLRTRSRTCECETVRGGRLCPTPMPARCDCVVLDDSTRLCPTPLAPDGTCAGGRSSLVGPYGGAGKKTGDGCTGYDGSTKATGKLSCEVCYERQTLSGYDGGPCAGVDTWGAAGRGKLVCR